MDIPSQSSSPHKCRFHFGFNLVFEEAERLIVKGGGKTYHWAEQNCTTGVMPDGHGLAGWAGGLAWSGAGRRDQRGSRFCSAATTACVQKAHRAPSSDERAEYPSSPQTHQELSSAKIQPFYSS